MTARFYLAIAWAGIAASCEVGSGATVWAQGAVLPATQTPSGAVAPGAAQGALARRIGLRLTDVTLKSALETVADSAGIVISYSGDAVPAKRRVSLTADHISVGEALDVLLEDTGFEAVLVAPKVVAVQPVMRNREEAERRQSGSGTVTGQVTDAKTGQPVADVTVSVGATQIGARTDIAGRYAIRRVPLGEEAITFRHLGYLRAVRTVTVAADSTLRLDVALTPSPAVLDQVVTTATGNQRLREIGNAIGTIDVADSVVGVAPVTTLSDIINARLPGVQVFTDGGLVGASPAINIRGLTSAFLSSQPVLYIDGVRVDNSAASRSAVDPGYHPAPGGLDDIPPEDIASIEVVRGPSASTLYGTDAATGVILVTTKRGAVGHPRWDMWGEYGTSRPADLSRIAPSYYAWGHTTGGTSIPVECTLAPLYAGAPALATQTCVQDSVTHFSALTNPATTPFGTGYTQDLGGQLSGGNAAGRYFLSGLYDDQTGYIHLSQVDYPTLVAFQGGAPVTSAESRPNVATKTALRANLDLQPAGAFDVPLTVAVQWNDARIPTSTFSQGGLIGFGYRDSLDEGYCCGGGLGRPYYYFYQTDQHSLVSWQASASPTWHPREWLTARATTGVDLSTDNEEELTPFVPTTPGNISTGTTALTIYTAQGSVTASASPLPAITSRTSAGAQYTNTISHLTSNFALLNAPGCLLVQCGTSMFGSTVTTQNIVAGAFGEETLGWRDRLFVTGALRADEGSSFGNRAPAAVYPKASASWDLSHERFFPRIAGSDLRLRAAYGQSGIEPPPTATLNLATLGQATLAGGSSVAAAGFPTYGNPNLQPERTQEFEAGADLGLVNGRIRFEGTVYTKHTDDALSTITLPASVGGYQELINIGQVRDQGYELHASAAVIDQRWASWQVDVSGSVNHNQLLTLGPGVVSSPSIGIPSNVVGYALGSWVEPTVQYADANHDGIIEPNEVTTGSTPRFDGLANPPEQATIGSTISIFQHRVQARVQIDYRGGFSEIDANASNQCFGESRAQTVVGSGLAAQAACAAILAGNPSYAGVIEDASFWRLREVALSYIVPRGGMRAFGDHSVTLTLSARNLALWTRFRGPDAEDAGSEITQSYYGSTLRPAYYDNGGVEPAVIWLLRLAVGL